MAACCTLDNENKPGILKQPCPSCGQAALEVSRQTMMQHIKDVWAYPFSDEAYYFCRSPACEVVYFTASGEQLDKSAIRTTIGIKEQNDEAIICYCFGINKIMAANKDVKDFVIQQTRESSCACETSNPSGRCCLKDFPK